MASPARWKSIKAKSSSSGISVTSGGSPAIRERVMRSCMILMLDATTSKKPGEPPSWEEK